MGWEAVADYYIQKPYIYPTQHPDQKEPDERQQKETKTQIKTIDTIERCNDGQNEKQR